MGRIDISTAKSSNWTQVSVTKMKITSAVLILWLACTFPVHSFSRENRALSPHMGIEERVGIIEESVADLQVSPRTTQDSLVAALNDAWPTVPGKLDELISEAKKNVKTMDSLSNKADYLMDRLKEVYSRSTENQKTNFRQDEEILSLQKEQVAIAGRQDKIEGTWAGFMKGSMVTVAASLVTGFFSVLFFIARAGLLKKIFEGKKLDRRTKDVL